MVIDGTSANDNLSGSTGDDRFRLWIGGGGDDTASGDAGHDVFVMRDTFNPADAIDGGADSDRVNLNGDYSAAFVFTDTTMVNVERLRCAGPFDYNLTTADGTVAAGARLVVNASSAHSLTFDGSAETDGRFYIYGSTGNDNITGGDQNDRFAMNKGGDDTVAGGDGNDVFLMGPNMTPDDRIDGGNGFDTVHLRGDYTGGNALVFTDTTMVAVERLRVAPNHSYDITTADGTVDSFSNLTLIVNASRLGTGDSLHFDGSGEISGDGNYTIRGGHGNDTVIGSVEGDTIAGNGGVDTLTGNSGNDTFVYHTAAESTGTNFDWITDMHFAIALRPPPDATDSGDGPQTGVPGPEEDFIALPRTVSSIGYVFNGHVDSATFEDDIAAAAGTSLDVCLIDVGSGSFAGRSFLVIDMNGNAQYDAGAGTDLLIEVTGYSGFPQPENFI